MLQQSYLLSPIVRPVIAISCTTPNIGANPRKSASNIYLIITSLSNFVSFFELVSQSRRKQTPARQLRSVLSEILNIFAI